MKTSTGFSTGGAIIEDTELMREAVGPIMGVKASGGARTLEAAKALSKLVQPVLVLRQEWPL